MQIPLLFISRRVRSPCLRYTRYLSTSPGSEVIKEAKIAVMNLSSCGKSEEQIITMRSLQETVPGLHIRDLLSVGVSLASNKNRVHVQQKLSTSNTILPRETFTLAAFGSIKLVLLDENVLIFNPSIPVVRSWIDYLSWQLKSEANKGMDFELFILEDLLREACDSFDRKRSLYSSLLKTIMSKEAGSKHNADDSVLDQSLFYKLFFEENQTMDKKHETFIYKLSPMRDLLYDFELQLRDAQKCLTDIVNNPDDLAKLSHTLLEIARKERAQTMNFFGVAASSFSSLTSTGKSISQQQPSDHLSNVNSLIQDNKAELMLENYILRLSHTLSGCLNLQQRVKSQQQLADLSLKLQRNRYMHLNVNLAAAGVVIAFASGSFGAWGMNMASGLEDIPFIFYAVTGSSLGISAFLYVRLLKYMRGDFSQSVEESQLEERQRLESVFTDIDVVDHVINKALHECRANGDGSTSSQLISREDFSKLLAEVQCVKEADPREVDVLYSLLNKNRNLAVVGNNERNSFY